MHDIKVTIGIAAIFLWGSGCALQRAPLLPLPEGWSLLERHAEAGDCPMDAWEVTLEHNQIVIHSYQWLKDVPLPFEGPLQDDIPRFGRQITKLADGWLIGADMGEFGGGLWWFSDEGTRRQELSHENVTGFIRLSSSHLLILFGYTHLGYDKGSIGLLKRDDTGAYVLHSVTKLESAVRGGIVDSMESCLVVTTTGVYRVMLSGERELLKSLEYSEFPNSLVQLSNGILYIGMRGFVTRLVPTPSGYKEERLVPQQCQ